MLIGNQELQLTIKRYKNSSDYLTEFRNLADGNYEYLIGNEVVSLYTIFGDRSGWIEVVNVSGSTDVHLNADAVDGVKLSDEMIDRLRTDKHRYNVRASSENFTPRNNEWLSYPHSMYVHMSMSTFSSVLRTYDNPNSNLVSVSVDADPIRLQQGVNSIGFGESDCGDTFFSYGANNQTGFFQSFSGNASGKVYVR